MSQNELSPGCPIKNGRVVGAQPAENQTDSSTSSTNADPHRPAPTGGIQGHAPKLRHEWRQCGPPRGGGRGTSVLKRFLLDNGLLESKVKNWQRASRSHERREFVVAAGGLEECLAHVLIYTYRFCMLFASEVIDCHVRTIYPYTGECQNLLRALLIRGQTKGGQCRARV